MRSLAQPRLWVRYRNLLAERYLEVALTVVSYECAAILSG